MPEQILRAVSLKPYNHKVHGKAEAKACQSFHAAAAVLEGNRASCRQKLEEHLQAMHAAAGNLGLA